MPYKDHEKERERKRLYSREHRVQSAQANRKYRAKHLQDCRARGRKWHYIRRAFIDSLKDKPCVDCGIKYPPFVMDFDHLSDKVMQISQMLTRKKEVILREAAKCDVVCSNCHRIRTHMRRITADVEI